MIPSVLVDLPQKAVDPYSVDSWLLALEFVLNVYRLFTHQTVRCHCLKQRHTQ